MCFTFMNKGIIWRGFLAIALLVVLGGWWYMSPYEPVYSTETGLAAPALFVQECRSSNEVLRIRQVAGHMVPSGSVFRIYSNTNRDTGITLVLPAELSPGMFVDAEVSRPLQSGTYFLYGRGIITTTFECWRRRDRTHWRSDS